MEAEAAGATSLSLTMMMWTSWTLLLPEQRFSPSASAVRSKWPVASTGLPPSASGVSCAMNATAGHRVSFDVAMDLTSRTRAGKRCD